MPLTRGDRLGPYEILAPIGAGGMGAVYRARDTRLGRTVALKVLHDPFTDRFEQEARALAALNHPHICALYDVGPDYLVMEFIDGKALQGPLPVEMALRFAREITSALDAAHRAGIVHRDLKPGNILITKSGAKLLDFGLARAREPLAQDAATHAMTEQGAIVGTLQYMSPEQIEGKEADFRSDIFAFGCVLYETLSGHPAFEGQSKASLIAAILNGRPKQLAGAPPAAARVVERCLAKDPEERWQSVRDLDCSLELAFGVGAAEAGRDTAPGRKWPVAALVAALLAFAGWAAAAWLAGRMSREVEWSGERLVGPAGSFAPRVSPDGHFIAFQTIIGGQAQIAVLKPETGNYTVLTHQPGGAIMQIAWSRDGAKIYFDRVSGVPMGVFSVPVLGGEPRPILEKAGGPQVLADGSLAVVRVNGRHKWQLYRFWPDSGKLNALPAIPQLTFSTIIARATPDGRNLIVFGNRADRDGEPKDNGLFALDPESGRVQRLAPGIVFRGGDRVAVAGKHDGRTAIVSAPFGALYRFVEVPLDGGDKLRTLLTSTLPACGIDEGSDGLIYADQYSAAMSLVRFPATGGRPERLTEPYSERIDPLAALAGGSSLVQLGRRTFIIDRIGKMFPLLETSEALGAPATTVGQGRVALTSDRDPPEIAVVSIDGGRVISRVRLKTGPVQSLAASPDGQRFFYAASGFIWSIAASGGSETRITAGESVAADPNGRDLVIAFQTQDSTQLVRVPVTGGLPQPIASRGDSRLAQPNLTSGAVGRDGKILVTATSNSRWVLCAGLVDPKGTLAPIPLSYDGETQRPMWASDGQIVAMSRDYQFTLLRFRPSAR